MSGEGVCRIRNNQELKKLCEIPDLSVKTRWLENVIRMNETYEVKKIFENKSEGINKSYKMNTAMVWKI
jgi:hypothetical protein